MNAHLRPPIPAAGGALALRYALMTAILPTHRSVMKFRILGPMEANIGSVSPALGSRLCIALVMLLLKPLGNTLKDA